MVDFITIILIIIFLIAIAVAYWLGQKSGAFKRDKFWEGEIPSYRKDAVMKSRAVLGGHFSEQLAPFLPDFKHLPNECRFVGKPVDLIVFKGMDDKDINEVIFVEVKSGKARLSPVEKKLKETIKKKKVKWEEYRIPQKLTSKEGVEDKITEVVESLGETTKKFLCIACGRRINHQGKCLPCNIKAKRKKKYRKN